MIWDHPGMLRLVGLYCVHTDFCMGRKETERGWYYVGRRKMLCWATKQKVSDSLFPIQSVCSLEGRLSSCHGSGASWQSDSGRGRPAASQTMAGQQRSLYTLCMHACVCVRMRREGWGCALLESYIQLKPGPGFSLETCTFERRTGGWGGGLCYIHIQHFPFNQLVWMWKIRVLNMTVGGPYRIEASYRYSTLYRKNPGCNKVQMLNVLNDSYSYITRHTTLKAFLFRGTQGLFDCQGGGTQMDECMQVVGECFKAQQSRKSLVQFTATRSRWTNELHLLSNNATLNSNMAFALK